MGRAAATAIALVSHLDVGSTTHLVEFLEHVIRTIHPDDMLVCAAGVPPQAKHIEQDGQTLAHQLKLDAKKVNREVSIPDEQLCAWGLEAELGAALAHCASVRCREPVTLFVTEDIKSYVHLLLSLPGACEGCGRVRVEVVPIDFTKWERTLRTLRGAFAQTLVQLSANEWEIREEGKLTLKKR